jgi:hypothetical protein
MPLQIGDWGRKKKLLASLLAAFHDRLRCMPAMPTVAPPPPMQ